MTQLNPLRNKKKSRKPEKNDKKKETSRPDTPVDKRAEAEKNLKEMIREAHKLHKDHIKRLRIRKLKTTVSDSAGRAPGNARGLGRNRKELSGVQSMKIRPKRSERAAKRRTDEKRAGGDDGGQRRGPSPLQPGGRTVGQVRSAERSRPEEDANLQIKDYQVAGEAFVCLDLLDMMKCHESDLCVRGPEASRPREEDDEKPREAPRDASALKLKKLRARKIREEVKKSAGGNGADDRRRPVPAARERKRRVKIHQKRASAKCETPKRSSTSSSSDKPRIPPLSTPKSDTDSNPSSLIGDGDQFSSNSYFSSESDVSKIDRKFMEILEAVTQNLTIDIGGKLREAQEDQPGRVGAGRSGDGGEVSDDSKSFGQNPAQQIDPPEETLQTSKSETENTEKSSFGVSPNRVVITFPVVEELWTKERGMRKELPKLTIGERGEKSFEDGDDEGDSTGRDKNPHRMLKSRVMPNAATTNLEEWKKAEEKRHAGKEEGNPSAGPKNDLKPRRSGTTVWAAGGCEAAAEAQRVGGKAHERPVETWSLVRRLEKAFETLGLDMSDLENSEDESPDKSKPWPRKGEPSGKERRCAPKNASDHTQNPGGKKATRRSAQRAEGTSGVESNGSGDKNLDYRALRSSSKQEQMARVPKDAGIKGTHDRDAYFASVSLRFRQKVPKCGDIGDLSDGKLKPTLTRKKCGEDEDHPTEVGVTAKSRLTMRTLPGDFDETARRWKGSRTAGNMDDGHATKRRSNCSLTRSRSISGPSDEDVFSARKSKRRRPAVSMGVGEGDSSDGSWKMGASGKGDTPPESPTPLPGDRSRMDEGAKDELRALREQHNQIISEIKSSLEELKKQHNLYTELRDRTRNLKDYDTKRDLMASYLRDVEESRESRRASPTDEWLNRRVKLREKLSDYGAEIMRLERRLREDSQERYRDEFALNAMEKSPRATCPSDAVSSFETESFNMAESPCRCESKRSHRTKKRGAERLRRRKRVPSNLHEFLTKIRRIIVTEKNHLEDLVVKASGSSSNAHSNRAKPQPRTTCSGCQCPRRQLDGMEEAIRTNSQGCKTTSADLFWRREPRQHREKGEANASWDTSADEDSGNTSLKRSWTSVQNDPGGGGTPALRSCCNAAAIDSDEELGEFRYRKGDPSFQSREDSAKADLDCRCKSPVDEEASRRKMELERILSGSVTYKAPEDEDSYLRKTELERILSGSTKHCLDSEPYALGYGEARHSFTRHRPQSIIIDHDRGEENEESETVLGHATRHSGNYKSDRRIIHEYYLRGGRRSESSYRKMQEVLKRAGKRYYDEDPVNCRDLFVGGAAYPSMRCRDADCQTEMADDTDDCCDIYLLDECGSGSSFEF